MRRIIHAFKYEGRRGLAVPLGRMLVSTAGDVLGNASCVVPVPLHLTRRLSRGFNQALDLARSLPCPVVNGLVRVRATRPQESLTAAERRENVNAAFRLSPVLSAARRRRLIEGQVVIVVDDVRTTGATLEECADALMHAGAREVRGLTVALAGSRHRDRVQDDARGARPATEGNRRLG